MVKPESKRSKVPPPAASLAPAVRLQPEDLRGLFNPNDLVAVSFWIISIAMLASTVFLMESIAVAHHWKTSMN